MEEISAQSALPILDYLCPIHSKKSFKLCAPEDSEHSIEYFTRYNLRAEERR